MMTVAVWINERRIAKGYARRVKGGVDSDSMNTYRLEDGTLIKHRYGDGAWALVEKIARHEKEREGRRVPTAKDF